MTSAQALPVVRRYHEGWTSKNFDQSIELLACTLEVEVPINDYPTAQSFGQALRSFGSQVTSVELLSEMTDGDEAMLLYDMQVRQLGTLRVVEHFTVADGRITRLRQIHDTAAIRAASSPPPPEAAGGATISSSDAFTLELPFAVARGRVFDALTTRSGLAGWWTPLVSGTPSPGGQIELGFAGVDETIVMRVDHAQPPSNVTWTCLEHTGHPEWQGTTIVFELSHVNPDAGLLRFHHIGLHPALACYETCEAGWDHFLASLLSYAQSGKGSPF